MTTTPDLQGEFRPPVPSRVIFGRGKASQLPEEVAGLGGKRVLLLSGRSVAEKTGTVSRIASLLNQVDSSVLEDALLDKVDEFDMHAPIGMGDVTVSAFRVFSEAGETLVLPPIHDPEIKDVIQTLHNAAPGLFGKAVRNAWERAGSES